MPYKIAKRGSQWVTKNGDTGKVYGHHPTRERALAQARALYANTKDEKLSEGGDVESLPEMLHKTLGKCPRCGFSYGGPVDHVDGFHADEKRQKFAQALKYRGE